MVSNSALAALSVHAGLHKFLMFDSPGLAASIESYAARVEERRRIEYEIAAAEGRSPGQYWIDVEAPKVLHTPLS